VLRFGGWPLVIELVGTTFHAAQGTNVASHTLLVTAGSCSTCLRARLENTSNLPGLLPAIDYGVICLTSFIERIAMDKPPLPPDRLHEVGVLTRREIEARILAPFIEALATEFDRERVLAILRNTIIEVARTQGAQLVTAMGGDSLEHFNQSLEYWTRAGALEIDVLEQNNERLSFNVNRCRYAEMYRALGIPELGALLSCNRDFALIQGFNPEVALTRTHTIMEGAPFCNFRYTRQAGDETDHATE
jgi:hypothetical protein